MIVLEILIWIFLISGSFFAMVGGFGIIRLPEFFSRLHAGGITDTLGAGLIVTGLLIFAAQSAFTDPDGNSVAHGLTAVKLLMIMFFLVVTSPASCHALAKSALTQGVKPELEINTVESNKSKAGSR